MPIQLAMVGLVVADMRRSLDFYPDGNPILITAEDPAAVIP